MGQEIKSICFTDDDSKDFIEKIQQETKIVKKWFENKHFVSNHKIGCELEAWYLDNDYLPCPESDLFLQQINNPSVVPEISRFNFEINGDPFEFDRYVFSNIANNLTQTWDQCHKTALKNNRRALLIGSLPTLKDSMLNMNFLYPHRRYEALCEQVMKLRNGEPLKLEIHGNDILYSDKTDVITECSATSLQIHVGVDQDKAARYYNASVIASPFMAALCANSPFLFGNELWDETRIAVFEQAVDLNGHIDIDGNYTKRVSIGNGYVKNSLFELYQQNIDLFPPLLPEIFESKPEEMRHLHLHNGTIWRWNRPIIGFDTRGNPHLRIEHRVPSSGPTLDDITANIMFFVGLSTHFSNLKEPLEEKIKFHNLKNIFYSCCRKGLRAQFPWIDGKIRCVRDIILQELLPNVAQTLKVKGTDQASIDYYINDVIYNRLASGQNGASWQKSFISKHGKDFQRMTQIYCENQLEGTPVWKWHI